MKYFESIISNHSWGHTSLLNSPERMKSYSRVSTSHPLNGTCFSLLYIFRPSPFLDLEWKCGVCTSPLKSCSSVLSYITLKAFVANLSSKIPFLSFLFHSLVPSNSVSSDCKYKAGSNFWDNLTFTFLTIRGEWMRFILSWYFWEGMVCSFKLIVATFAYLFLFSASFSSLDNTGDSTHSLPNPSLW